MESKFWDFNGGDWIQSVRKSIIGFLNFKDKSLKYVMQESASFLIWSNFELNISVTCGGVQVVWYLRK